MTSENSPFDYDKGTLQGCQRIIQQARQHHIPVLVDPKGTDFERYRGATLITPNLKEFEAVVGTVSEQVLIEKGKQLLSDLELAAPLITRSENGIRDSKMPRTMQRRSYTFRHGLEKYLM